MGLSRSTYYFELSKKDAVSERNATISKEIQSIFEHNKRRYGVRRVHRELINRGYTINHKRVQRIMHSLGLAGKRPKEKYHSYKGDVGKVAPNIVNRDFSTTAPTSPNMEQIHRMLDKAFKKFPSIDVLLFHSDQGWQYQHASYRSALKDHGIIQSMSRKGNCYDNCIMETFFGRLKNEMYYGQEKDYASFDIFAKAMEEYIEYYNNERIQAKTKWMPPVKYRETSICSGY